MRCFEGQLLMILKKAGMVITRLSAPSCERLHATSCLSYCLPGSHSCSSHHVVYGKRMCKRRATMWEGQTRTQTRVHTSSQQLGLILVRRSGHQFRLCQFRGLGIMLICSTQQTLFILATNGMPGRQVASIACYRSFYSFGKSTLTSNRKHAIQVF